jgi:ABC-type multidrug transport system ATPase subunit
MQTLSNFSVENLSFKFTATSNYFFQDLSYSCKEHQLYLLRGVNGSGKSTLLRLLLGNINQGELVTGTITTHGYRFDIAYKNDRAQLPKFISYVPQNSMLLLADNLTVYQNIRMASLGRYPTLGFLPMNVNHHHLLQKTNIDTEQRVSQLSGGQRQLLAIISALQKTTRILLLDEPTTALDHHNVRMIIDFLQDLVAEQPMTIIMVNHNQEIIDRLVMAKMLTLSVDEISEIRTLQ